MATAAHGPLPPDIATDEMRMEFTSSQITLCLFIVVAILIGLGFMSYLFVCHGQKQQPELDRPRDDRWIWSYGNSSSGPLDLL
jgi:hypothetical protein